MRTAVPEKILKIIEDIETRKNVPLTRLTVLKRWFEEPGRIIHCWPLLLVEEGLALHLGQAHTPYDGYKLAVDWAQHYDPAYGPGLNGPSRGKLQELLRFMFAVEAREEENWYGQEQFQRAQ